MKFFSKQYSYLEIYQLMKTLDLRGIENFYFHDKDYFTIQCMPKLYLTIKFPSTIFISDVKLTANKTTKSKEILRKYCKRQFGDFSILERERVLIFENDNVKLIISLFLKGNIELYIKKNHKEYENIKRFLQEKNDMKLIYSLRKEPFEINEKKINLIEEEIKKLDYSQSDEDLSKEISKILLIPNRISKQLINLDEDKKKVLLKFYNDKYNSISKCFIDTKSNIKLEEIEKTLHFFNTNKQIHENQRNMLEQWFEELEGFNIYGGDLELENISKVIKIIYSTAIILENTKVQSNPQKISLEKSFEKQEKSIKSWQKKSLENQRKGELIYENYQELQNILKIINEAIKNHGIKKVNEIIKKSKYKNIIKSINEKNKKITIDILELKKI